MIDSIISSNSILQNNAPPKLPGTASQEKTSIEEKQLTLKEKLDVEHFEQMERNIQRHENDHLRVARDLAIGGPSFKYEKGPDGKKYAVSGEVQIEGSADIESDPEAVIEKALKIERAALAPSDPSPKDLRTASQAKIIETKARRKLSRDKIEETRLKNENSEDLGIPPGLREYKKNSDYQKNLYSILDLFS